MTLQKRVPENFRSCRWGAERRVSYFHFSYLILFLPPLFKTTEGVVVLFQIFAWAPKKNNKNLGKKIFDPAPPPGPLGPIFRFFLGFFENFEGDSAETCAGKFPLMSVGG